ncbi:exocyst complex component Sec3-domain-containing protein [Tribonema minus]|uniref:Exocyst complex component Sec3-domain-containing protein n=1 Tax=Tribonema minus TaxID=303371 RepID=A0A835YUC5_9STRA|nr:exocyst complex component Sec3-domain-containing protein [Tribonema minus]
MAQAPSNNSLGQPNSVQEVAASGGGLIEINKAKAMGLNEVGGTVTYQSCQRTEEDDMLEFGLESRRSKKAAAAAANAAPSARFARMGSTLTPERPAARSPRSPLSSDDESTGGRGWQSQQQQQQQAQQQSGRRGSRGSVSSANGGGGLSAAAMSAMIVAQVERLLPRGSGMGGTRMEGTGMSVSLHNSWPIQTLTGADRPNKEGAILSLAFAPKPAGSSNKSASGDIAVYTWEAQSPLLCKEVLWVILSLRRALSRGASPDAVAGLAKELDASATYEGFHAKYPKLYGLLKAATSEPAKVVQSTPAALTASKDAQNREAAAAAATVTSAELEELERGEELLQRLGWKEKGQEGLEVALDEELENLEGSTIPQLIRWSETEDSAQTLVSILDDIDDQLAVMQRDMAPIERQNNALDVQWRNYRALQDHLSVLVDAITLPFEEEAVLRDFSKMDEYSLDKEIVLKSVINASESLLSAVDAGRRLGDAPQTARLRMVTDGRAHLTLVADQFIASLTATLKKLIKRLANEAVNASQRGGLAGITGDGATQRLLQYKASDSSTNRHAVSSSSFELQDDAFDGHHVHCTSTCLPMNRYVCCDGTSQAQKQFHSDLKKYAALFEQVRLLEGGGPPTMDGQPPPPSSMPNSVSLQRAYAEELGGTLLKGFSTKFFSDLLPRVQFARSSASSMAALDRAVLGAEPRGLTIRITRDQVSDMLGALTVLDEAHGRADCENHIAAHVILEFKVILVGKFNKFIGEQVLWVQNSKTDAKRPGVLAPFAKLPSLVDRMQTAQANPKYANVIKMENLYFFKHTIGLRDVPVLEDYVLQASSNFDTTSQNYLEWVLRCQFPHAMAFFARIEELVASVGAQDVPYHEPKKNLDAMLKRHLDEKTVPDGLKLIYARMNKHLSKESCLLPVLWDHLNDMLFAQFSRYEELCHVCYGFKMVPSASQVPCRYPSQRACATRTVQVQRPPSALHQHHASGSSGISNNRYLHLHSIAQRLCQRLLLHPERFGIDVRACIGHRAINEIQAAVPRFLHEMLLHFEKSTIVGRYARHFGGEDRDMLAQALKWYRCLSDTGNYGGILLAVVVRPFAVRLKLAEVHLEPQRCRVYSCHSHMYSMRDAKAK